MSALTTDEAMNLKAELDLDVALLVKKFNDATGFVVTNLDVRYGQISGYRRPTLLHVESRVEVFYNDRKE